MAATTSGRQGSCPCCPECCTLKMTLSSVRATGCSLSRPCRCTSWCSASSQLGGRRSAERTWQVTWFLPCSLLPEHLIHCQHFSNEAMLTDVVVGVPENTLQATHSVPCVQQWTWPGDPGHCTVSAEASPRLRGVWKWRWLQIQPPTRGPHSPVHPAPLSHNVSPFVKPKKAISSGFWTHSSMNLKLFSYLSIPMNLCSGIGGQCMPGRSNLSGHPAAWPITLK